MWIRQCAEEMEQWKEFECIDRNNSLSKMVRCVQIVAYRTELTNKSESVQFAVECFSHMSRGQSSGWFHYFMYLVGLVPYACWSIQYRMMVECTAMHRFHSKKTLLNKFSDDIQCSLVRLLMVGETQFYQLFMCSRHSPIRPLSFWSSQAARRTK